MRPSSLMLFKTVLFAALIGVAVSVSCSGATPYSFGSKCYTNGMGSNSCFVKLSGKFADATTFKCVGTCPSGTCGNQASGNCDAGCGVVSSAQQYCLSSTRTCIASCYPNNALFNYVDPNTHLGSCVSNCNTYSNEIGQITGSGSSAVGACVTKTNSASGCSSGEYYDAGQNACVSPSQCSSKTYADPPTLACVAATSCYYGMGFADTSIKTCVPDQFSCATGIGNLVGRVCDSSPCTTASTGSVVVTGVKLCTQLPFIFSSTTLQSSSTPITINAAGGVSVGRQCAIAPSGLGSNGVSFLGTGYAVNNPFVYPPLVQSSKAVGPSYCCRYSGYWDGVNTCTVNFCNTPTPYTTGVALAAGAKAGDTCYAQCYSSTGSAEPSTPLGTPTNANLGEGIFFTGLAVSNPSGKTLLSSLTTGTRSAYAFTDVNGWFAPAYPIITTTIGTKKRGSGDFVQYACLQKGVYDGTSQCNFKCDNKIVTSGFYYVGKDCYATCYAST